MDGFPKLIFFVFFNILGVLPSISDFLSIFEAEMGSNPPKSLDMKKLVILSLTALLLVLYSCKDHPSKAFQTMQKSIKDVETQIVETENCDDLQLFTFAVLGLRTDLEKLQEDETVKEGELLELLNEVDQLDASLTGKYAMLNCEQNNSGEMEIEAFGEDEYEEYDDL